MAEKKIPEKTMGRSKIVKYRLEDDAIMLRSEGKSYEQIAQILNQNPNVPKSDPINMWAVERFLKSLPELRAQAVRADRRRLLNMLTRQVNMYDALISQYNHIKVMWDEENGKQNPDHKAIKVYSSEARELLKMINGMQAEINSQQNVKEFIEIVLSTVNEIAPSCVEPIIKKLKLKQDSMFQISNER